MGLSCIFRFEKEYSREIYNWAKSFFTTEFSEVNVMCGFCFLCYSNQCVGRHTIHSRWCFRAVHIAAVRRHAASHHEECAPCSQDPFCVRPERLPGE